MRLMSCYSQASPLTGLECGQMHGHSTMVEANKGFQVVARPCALAGCVFSPAIYLHLSFFFSLTLCIYQDKMFALYTGRSLKQVGSRNILCTLYDLQNCSLCRKHVPHKLFVVRRQSLFLALAGCAISPTTSFSHILLFSLTLRCTPTSFPAPHSCIKDGGGNVDRFGIPRGGAVIDI